MYFTNKPYLKKIKITITRLTFQTGSVCLWTHFKSRLNIYYYKSLYCSPGPCFLDCPIDPYIIHTMFTACRHLWSDPDLTNTILKGDHPRTSVTKLYSSWLGGFREEDLWMCFSRGSNVNLGSTWRSCWFGPKPAGRNCERGPSKDHCDQVWFQLTQKFVRRRSFNVFPHRVLC